MGNFSIDFEWLPRNFGDPASLATFAEIRITVCGLNATELIDQTSRTTRNGVRGSAYTLALWLAFNWWRLRFEAEQSSSSWKMSHLIGAAGDGYLWPALTLSSDGNAVLISSRPTSSASEQPIRYLNHFDQIISANEFEQGVDQFVGAVVSRLKELSIDDEELSGLWGEIIEERRTPEISRWRRLEAILGFDPGEGPEPFLDELIAARDVYGAWAVEELAAESKLDAMSHLQVLWNGIRQGATPLKIPAHESLRTQIKVALTNVSPWGAAEKTAQIAREAWSLENGPISNSDINDLFCIEHDLLGELTEHEATAPINVGYRNESPDVISASLIGRYQNSRRFALLRLVGDHLLAPEEDRLLPAGKKSRTYRQKFQRAFAQEILCPYKGLMQHLASTEPTDDEIEDAAEFFKVSPIMIHTILVNRGHVARERFFNDAGKSLLCE